MRLFATALIFCGVLASAQPSQEQTLVPGQIQFAGMTLSIREDARAEIQHDVDALTQSPKYYNIKAERAKTYFPLIERIFQEERVPTDFKFLAIQESALIADAVSVTDAVGFWQFKDFTASEMGLRVDAEVDERMNIVSSTRAAARYIKKNNYMFNNWVYALQAYQMGAGDVKRAVGDDDDGSREMEITVDTYWYVKKYIAHKVAFERVVGQEGAVKISELEISSGARFSDILARVDVDEKQLREFNKWIRRSVIPSDRSYVVIVPSGSMPQDFSFTPSVKVVSHPTITDAPPLSEVEEMINDIPVIQAREGETLQALAARSGLDMNQFVRYNELSSDHAVVAGGYYFKAKKKSHTEQEQHTLGPGEDLWSVSQLYGIHIKRLRKLNDLEDGEKPAAGSIIWLNSHRPYEDENVDNQTNVVTVNAEFIDWSRPAQSTQGEHFVKAGETLYAISRQYTISVEELRTLNQLHSDNLSPGQRLRIAQAGEATDGEVTGIVHEVKQSETLYSVAKRYGVSVKEIMESNHKTEFSVALGEKLRIPAR